MATVAPFLSQSPLRNESRPAHRPLPTHSHSATPSESTSASEDLMDITPVNTAAMGPPGSDSPTGRGNLVGGLGENATGASSVQALGSAVNAPIPKIVNVAFIHKLYSMLEDTSIQHLISWSSSNESFLISPSGEFSKVLAGYFKHTNISSFVRQLNMYGFSKVSDVFHSGNPESPLWEFKHGNGSFKRGDMSGLRDIKRRASKHALIHRDSFSSASKMGVPQNGPIPEPMPDSLEGRMTAMEHNFYEIQARLARTEDSQAIILSKYQMLSETLDKCFQCNHDLSAALLSLVPDPDHQLHRDVVFMQKKIKSQIDSFKDFENQVSRRPSFSHNLPMEPPQSISPRQMPQDRRPSVLGTSRQSSFRLPVTHRPSPRHFGSIGNGTTSPSTLRPPAPSLPPPPPQPPQAPGPDASSLSPSFPSRRHTSADIRLENGWLANMDPNHTPQPQQTPSAYASAQWPSSPQGTPDINNGDQEIRDSLARYSLSNGPAQTSSLRPPQSSLSRNPSPPGAPDFRIQAAQHLGNGLDSGWSLPSARFNIFNKDVFRSKGVGVSAGYDTPGSMSRRTSMASNVHNLLNPTAESEEEDLDVDELRKRKRFG